MLVRIAVYSLMAITSALLGSGISGCSEKKPVVVEPLPRPARVVEVKAFERERVFSFVGTVRAPQTIDFAFELDGRIIAFPPKEGDIVSNGSLLAKLDAESHELGLHEAQAELALAEQELERVKSLVARDVVSQSQLDQATTHRDLLRCRTNWSPP